jgi:L-rhamnose-H+ transport protein
MELLFGLVLVVLSGGMAGTALTPIKFMRGYRFENYWLIHSLTGTVVLPWLLAYCAVPDLSKVYASVPALDLIRPPLFALSWGIASTLGGLCVVRIGLSLTYALIIGIGAAAGTLVPLAYFSPQIFGSVPGTVIVGGVAVMIAGLVLVTKAGRARERMEKAKAPQVPRRSYLAGISMATLAGILSTGLNFSFAFSQNLVAAARNTGASESSATYPVWAIAMLGGMVPNISYALAGCVRNQSWRQFTATLIPDLPLGMLMGTLFIGSTTVYGLGAVQLGALGTSVGWGIMQIVQIVVGNLGGFFTGEWKSAGPEPVRMMFASLAMLCAASVLMAYGNHLLSAKP